MVPTTRATVRLADKSSPSVLPGWRRRGLVRLLVAGLGLRLGLLLVPVLVARWVPWLAVRLVLPSGLALENGWPIKRMKVFKAGGTDDVVFWVNRHV